MNTISETKLHTMQTMSGWEVIIFDDKEHTFQYVIDMLVDLFGKSKKEASDDALEIHRHGFCIVSVTTKERAELKKEQISSYGPDKRLPGKSTGSMKCTISKQ